MRITKLLLIVIFAAISVDESRGADDLQQKYVGMSTCAPELKSPLGYYGIRLDKIQNAYLDVYQFKDKNILTIVQRKNGNEECGVIRDVATSRNVNDSFVWECVDKNFPAEVVVGTWPKEYRRTSGPALEAWKIDLKDLKFIPVHTRVNCLVRSYAGTDEGDDLATWARQRASKRTSNRKK